MAVLSPLKVMTIVGTRPEIIRLSRVISVLNNHVNHIIVHTGQNYDYELNEVFFENLELRRPDYFLGINAVSLGNAVGDIIRKSEDVFLKEKPDAVLVLGDTNSCLAAYMAKRLHIPIFHMEAGNRSFDFNVPEEINRKIIDHIADFNLVYTEHARRHLISEGLQHRRIYLTGSPMYEVLSYYGQKINDSKIMDSLELTKKKYFVASIHREENVDNSANLVKIVSILNGLAEEYDFRVIVSTHPRTKKRLEELKNINIDNRVVFMKPFGFHDYNHLQIHAKCTLSDSGTISEESAILSFPAISLRQSMERPEAQDAGTIVLTGFEKNIVLGAVRTVIHEHENNNDYSDIPAEYLIKNTSLRVLKLILGNTKLSNKWWGIV
ncbi:non-hydrolyzing UDP-N-acetylglucosamine 2-epimerase [Desulfobacula toluolica]|uniref:WecB: UDP-N-acetylglucosamine 2-epimerase n=1 Tax=Desulfobacula toluolica (strain DSM 7467 / Tol2) TaxID=651182 RepID=K0N4E0_DESTT|nr:UDP-N-acetylglucosamine 2-epimerase (non-hydrolyzing) [Desulfobacula toluolica]CCK78979.1 WecB: UDP-N-acetylglucosamine 2-epimerase [Desulfobacula toluolica Tol2]